MKKINKFFSIILCFFLVNMFYTANKVQGKNSKTCATLAFDDQQAFYNESKDTIQLLILGDSKAKRAINPNVLWEEDRLTSYNLATASQPTWLSYYVLDDALRFQTPEVVILDSDMLFNSSQGYTERYCRTINSLSTSASRRKALQDEKSGFSSTEKEQLKTAYLKDYYFNSIKDYFNIKSRDLNRLTTKGFIINTQAVSYVVESDDKSKNTKTAKHFQSNRKDIDKIVKQCKEKKIELLLVSVPSVKDWTQERHELVTSYAKENSISFIDLNVHPYLESIDWRKDTRDGGQYLNIYGAEKVTKMIGEFVLKKYEINREVDEKITRSYQGASDISNKKTGKALENNEFGDIQ